MYIYIYPYIYICIYTAHIQKHQDIDVYINMRALYAIMYFQS